RADPEFTRFLDVARIGASGETYAFDSEGLFLSESRFREELVQAGLIPDRNSALSSRTVAVRDPGGDLAGGHVPELEVSARPLTELARLAIGSGDLADPQQQRGVILEPYRNYRGVEVIGAWAWLPDHDFGVATEMDVQEAFAPLRHLNAVFAVLLFALVGATGVGVFSSFAVVRLRKQVGEAQQLGQYTLVRKIGEGGLGEVHLARHALLKRPTAVKIL
ncbi:MAG: serine/threonine protein kinase, partial [bacterium]|nr:serine/threonine protein kinase [bacterium]